MVGLSIRQSCLRVYVHLVYFFGRMRGDFLDVHSAFAARHQAYALCYPVDYHADVELFADIRTFFDE